MKRIAWQRRLIRLVIAWLSAMGTASAGLAPENVLVVVNQHSWASMTVANAFVEARRIPPRNVVYLDLGKLYAFEHCDVETFRRQILTPVLTAIKERRLEEQILGIAYSTDIPYRINVKGDIEGNLGQTTTPEAAINGLTYTYEQVLAKQASQYLSLGINRYVRRAQVRLPAFPWKGKAMQYYNNGLAKMREKKWKEAEAILKQGLREQKDQPNLHIMLAGVLAQQNELDNAIKSLEEGIKCGWYNRTWLENDPNLKALQQHKGFKPALDQIKPPKVEADPPLAFRAWVAETYKDRKEKLPPFLPSIVLAWTSGRGMSVDEAVAHLARSAGADETNPQGTVYFMVNGDVRSTTRKWGFDGAIAALASVGVKGEAINGTLPQGKESVAGCVIGSAGFNWPGSKSVLLPGAIAEHLTSFGGAMHANSGQTPCTHLIQSGAAGSSGTVTEPYAIQAKFPTPYIQYYYACGSTLLEAFDQSVAGPYQLLIIGDPLCRPWGESVKFQMGGVKEDEVVKGDITFRFRTRNNVRLDHYELYLDGKHLRNVKPDKTATLAADKLEPGWHELGIAAVGEGGPEITTQERLRFERASRNQVDVSGRPSSKDLVAYGTVLNVGVACPGAKSVFLEHNGRVIAESGNASRTLKLDTGKLGCGAITVWPGATGGKENTRIYGKPFVVKIGPPKAANEKIPDWGSMKEGLAVTLNGKTSIRKATDQILSGLKAGDAYEIDGYLQVNGGGVQQLQLLCDGLTEMKINGEEITIPTGGKWHFWPMNGGTYHIEIKGKIAEQPKFEIRLGSQGARGINPNQCRTNKG